MCWCQSNLTARSTEVVNRNDEVNKPMAAPLSEFWAVEYHFLGDNFSVRPLPDYLILAQANWEERQLFGSVIVALRQAEQDAIDDGASWQALRDKRRLSVDGRQAKVQPYIDGLESLCEQRGGNQ